jgi:hypothetical protein
MNASDIVTSKYPSVTIVKSLKKNSDQVMNSKKLARANEMIEKSGLPEGYEHLDILTLEGVLKYANAENNTFAIAREVDWKEEIIDYEITALPQTLTDLVKKYWSEKITITVKPIRSNGEILKYKLIEIK